MGWEVALVLLLDTPGAWERVVCWEMDGLAGRIWE